MTSVGCHRTIVTLVLCVGCLQLETHAHHEHRGPTYEVTAPVRLPAGARKLQLTVIDHETGKPAAARFSLAVDGNDYTPEGLGSDGLRFVSIHQRKKQRFVALYARGTGGVAVPLPDGARRGRVFVAKGFDYLPEEIPFEVAGETVSVTATLRCWNDLAEEGWLPADEHLHYERTDPAHDRDWLAMLAGDGLTHAHFLVLKGANLPGVWARQFAHGKEGEAWDGKRLIRPGEEYRDGSQGHINLLGIDEVIPPISTGGIGQPSVPYNYPPFYDVFLRARKLGGIGGPAHGAALSRSPTAVLDTVLGAVDFFEIANTHLYKVDVWYRLVNCGYIVPPAAGTDLPNFPFRERWQPLLGEIRMYVRVGARRDFKSWKEALGRGEVFISSGPLIKFTAGGVGPGGTLRLPAGGDEVLLEAEIAGPRPLRALEVVQNGEVLAADTHQKKDGLVYRWSVRQRLRINRSGWLAARGAGVPKQALEEHTGIKQNTVAHTAAVRVLVGDQPISSAEDARVLFQQLTDQQDYYRTKARYEKPAHRERYLKLFDAGIEEIKRQAN